MQITKYLWKHNIWNKCSLFCTKYLDRSIGAYIKLVPTSDIFTKNNLCYLCENINKVFFLTVHRFMILLPPVGWRKQTIDLLKFNFCFATKNSTQGQV